MSDQTPIFVGRQVQFEKEFDKTRQRIAEVEAKLAEQENGA